MKPAVAFAALALAAVPLHASCVFNLRFQDGTLRWDPIPAAKHYRITEDLETKDSYSYITDEAELRTPRRATVPTKVKYTVTADLDTGVRSLADGEVFDSCTTSIDTTLPGDPELRKLLRKSVLPIVASGPGANGGRFRTSLTLRGVQMRGRLVFHPAGRAASESDPSIRYSFDNSPVLHFDDIVAAVGGSGVGSLDIIPDDDSQSRVPVAQAYLFNETPNGTFGTFAEAVLPVDYLHSGGHAIPIPDARFRVNAGFRTLTETTFRITVHSTDLRLRTFHDETFPAGWMQLNTAAELARTQLVPGEIVTISVVRGAAIPFHTLTENATNDATLVVAAPSTARVSGEYVD